MADQSLITDRDINVLACKCGALVGNHFIDEVYSPLNPSVWLKMLYNGVSWDPDSLFILDGVCNGFCVIEPGTRVPDKMNNILLKELAADKISIAKEKPH